MYDWAPRLDLFIVLLVSSIALLPNLDQGSLADWDEAGYAEVSKEIVQSDDFLVLHKAGKPWFEKPPLLFWLAAASYKLFGVTTFVSRIWPALFGIGTVVITFLIANELFDRKIALMSSLILVTSNHFNHMARMFMLDVPVTFFITLSIYLFLRTQRSGRGHILFGVSVGLGVMTKSPIGLFPVLIVGVCMVYSGTIRRAAYRPYLGSLLAFLAVTLPWNLLQSILNWEQWSYYVDYNGISRFYELYEHDYGNLFYLKVLWYGLGVWSIPAIVSFVVAIPAALKRRKEYLLLVCWALSVLGVFFMAKTKLPWYLIPLHPAIAILLGAFIVRLRFRNIQLGLVLFAALFLIAFRIPEPSYCNTMAYNIHAIAGNSLRIHDSIPQSPGLFFYLGGERFSSERLFDDGGLYLSTIPAYNAFFNSYAPVYVDGPFIVFARDGVSSSTFGLSKPPDYPEDPIGYCYAFMPMNLGLYY